MREDTEKTVARNCNKAGLLGLLVTLGIVFGDIGTSPLYVMKAILHTGETINESTILGALSCIIWTLTLQTTIKYVCVALRADNNGEGGILALYALLRRLKSKWIYILAIIGASTLLADGIITPAITVTTAIEGLESISPDLPVIPITLAIITIIFFVQRFGTESIGKSFGVFMLLWFLLLGVVGAVSITSYPLILKAFNPYYAIALLSQSPEWFLILGAVFLCTTGAEALYSDLGHCGRKNITISWAFVKTMLILNYLGQGAWVLNHVPTALSVNPFFAIMPLISFGLESIIIKAGDYSASNMTLNYWIGDAGSVSTTIGNSGILKDPAIWSAMGNSLKLSIICALIAGSCGVIIGYAVVRRKGTKLSNWVSGLSFFPYLVPAMAFSAIYLAISTNFPFLTNSFLILVLVGSVKYLPFATKAGTNSMLQLSPEIEEAAAIYGVPWLKRMTRIIIPIQKTSIISGFLLPFVSCMRELSLFVMLVSSKTQTLTTMLMTYNEKGASQYGNAINLLIILIVLFVNFTVNKVTGASIDKGVGGN